ncbi:hypothetical protein BURPSPAST_V0105 [Burkholderia pseudomallei Pasteur 52237]|uniref:Uncharacterized protein n=1 Tax=Burkholderia pseudomallei 1710a TaxID=320371 RepID=A0A0E1W468_BURPE|nr:hypothetical protein BURPSPAST_V0105 [Burkholderia pseudomallei Pasteur 52237]EET04457.1 hypothetical protein BURPS1710A_A0947 [Burkholderia pseudomallei 1710a]
MHDRHHPIERRRIPLQLMRALERPQARTLHQIIGVVRIAAEAASEGEQTG